MKLTHDEGCLLRQVSESPQTITGSGPRDGLNSLVDAGWLRGLSLNLSVTKYTITEAGRAMLAKQISDESIPTEDLNASNDE